MWGNAPFLYTVTNKLVSLKHVCSVSNTVPPEHVQALNSSTQPCIDASLLVGSQLQAKESQMMKGGKERKKAVELFSENTQGGRF